MTSISYAVTFQNGSSSSSRSKKTPTSTTTTTATATTPAAGASRRVRAGSLDISRTSIMATEGEAAAAIINTSVRGATPPLLASFYEPSSSSGTSNSGDASSLPAAQIMKLPPRNHAAASSSSLKKKRLLMELELLDQKLRQLDRQEASRKNKLQLRYNNNHNNKTCSILSPSGESSTMEMTASSVSDGLEWKDVLQDTEIIFINKQKTNKPTSMQGGHEHYHHHHQEEDCDASICSEVTLPLTPQEELERFIHAEVAMMEDMSLTSSSSSMHGGRATPSFLGTSSLTSANVISRRHSLQPQPLQQLYYAQQRPPPSPPQYHHHNHHNQQQHAFHHQHHHHHQQLPSPPMLYHQSHHPPSHHQQQPSHHHPPSRRHAEDAGDAQPGRVKNMPWLLTFADERPPLSVQYTGPIQNGIPHGVGTFRFRKSGDMYMGEIQHGRMHGIGMYRNSSSSGNNSSGGSSGGNSKRGGEIRRGKFVCNIFQVDPTAPLTTPPPHKPKSRSSSPKSGSNSRSNSPKSSSRHKRTAATTLG